MSKVSRVLVLLFLLMVPLVIWGQADVAEADEVPFVLLYENTGQFGLVNQGLGIDNGYDPITGATLPNYNVPGTIEAAYLLWQGADNISVDPGDDIIDSNVLLAVDGGAATAVTADTVRMHIQQNRTERHYYSYIADITPLVLQNAHDYTFSGFDMPTTEFGFGIFTVYNTGAFPEYHIQVFEGLDRFWRDEVVPVDQTQSEVHCATFTAVGSDRLVDIDMIAAGVGLDRDNQIYYQTGTGALPTDLEITGTQLEPQPFGQYDGSDWDSYENLAALTLPGGDEWVCVQITINEGTAPGEVASGMIQLVAMAVPTTTPTAVSLQSVDVSSSSAVLPFALGAFGLIIVSTGLVINRKRKSVQ